MNFRKTSEGGGRGVISDQKNFVAVFSVILGGVKTMNFRKKGGVTPIRMNFVANFRASRKKRNIVFQNEGGRGGVRGRLEVFRKFIQNGKHGLPLTESEETPSPSVVENYFIIIKWKQDFIADNFYIHLLKHIFNIGTQM